MANDLIEFQPGAVSQAFAWADPESESLSDGIGGSFGIIGYKGSRWSLRYKGQTFMFTREDGTLSPWIHCVILAQARHKSKSFYPKYKEGSDDPPLCASTDGITPDAGVTEKQADACGICPQNVLFINPETGKKTTACKDHKKLSVLLLAAETQRLLGQPLLEEVYLRVPAASLQNLALMGDAATKMGKPFCTFFTRITFDQTVPYPKLIFKGVQQLPDDMAPLIRELRESSTTQRILGGSNRPALAAPQAMQPLPTPHAQVLELEANPPQPLPTQPVSSVTTAVAQPTVSLEGFGPAQSAPPSSPAAAPQNVVADQGPPEEADDEMSARIAALMPK